MRRVLAHISVALLVVSAVTLCQQALASAPDAIPAVNAGTEFPVEVQGSINAANACAGDIVRFRTLHGILIGGNVVIPAHATLVGRVIEARPATQTEPSLLRFSIHLATWGKKSSAILNAVIAGRLRTKGNVRGDVHVVMPSFLEGVKIAYEPAPAATTWLTSQSDVVLRSGTLLVLRHLDSTARATAPVDTIPGQ